SLSGEREGIDGLKLQLTSPETCLRPAHRAGTRRTAGGGKRPDGRLLPLARPSAASSFRVDSIHPPCGDARPRLFATRRSSTAFVAGIAIGAQLGKAPSSFSAPGLPKSGALRKNWDYRASSCAPW